MIVSHFINDMTSSYHIDLPLPSNRKTTLCFFASKVLHLSPVFAVLMKRWWWIWTPLFARLLCSYFICRLTRIDWLCEITGHHRMIDINFVQKTMIALCICMNIDIEIYTFVSICIQKRRGGRFLFLIWSQRISLSFLFAFFHS